MTLAHSTDRLASARLVLPRIAPDDLPFFTRIHALPEVAQHLYPAGRPRSPEETAAWLRYTLASYEQLALGYLAVLRKEDGARDSQRMVRAPTGARGRRADIRV
jgi:RimJ/RimL family protein N-acetyltransferase